MPNDEESRPEPVDLSEYTRGAQSVKAGCGCLAVALLLGIVAYATRHFLFRR